MRFTLSSGALRGLGAALLFGLSTPIAKLLLPGTGPFTVAALLYLGSGLGFLLLGGLLPRGNEAPLRRSDLPLLAAVTASGGVVAPVLLMIGLSRLDGTSASLLLNLELPFTIALAVGLFGESLGRREVAGAAAVIAGSVLLASGGAAGRADVAGALAVAGATLGWALDNNLSQRLALRDPVAVVRVKTVVAGAVNVGLALLANERLPSGRAIAATLVTGFFGYGVSIVLHMLAIRELGAARQGTLFATAPFAGALAALPILGERLSARELVAGAAMAAGVGVMLRAHHVHEHAHEPLAHEHLHEHDAHHDHDHAGPVTEPHSHPHLHGPLVHDHPHTPDAHHRHAH
ncbi:MAG TPA: DMT family transporter [Anaeromyxobacteraceae bacterium]|nr:DMT family transporter [Anaeromyxobacteraceae bacterium]